MQEECKNIYKIAREVAGLTQVAAAMLIPCSESALSGYERGTLNVSDEMVENMIKVYKTPILAILHLKRKNSPLAKYIPDVIPPQTFGDVGMHAVLSQMEIDEAVELVKQLWRDGKITPDEHVDLKRFAETMRVISGRTLSAAIYAETILVQRGEADAA